MTRFLTALLIALLISPNGAPAQPMPAPSRPAVSAPVKKLPAGMTMHRRSAGQFDQTGWTSAASTLGGFSVRLPLTFNDYTAVSPPGVGQVAKAFTIGTKTAGGIKYLAVRLTYRQPGAARLFFAKIASSKKPPARRLRYRGRPAVDMTVRNTRQSARVRYVLVGETLAMVVVEVPNSQRGLVSDATITTFLESLRITRP